MRPSVPPPLPRHIQQGSVAQTVRALAPRSQPSEVWRGAAFAILRLNAKECEALGAIFEEEATTDDRRALVLDLLAGAGTFEAQVVMRRLLALAVARRDSRTFATYVQRLGFVERPDGPTLRFLMSVVAESRNEPPEIRAACVYALGAAAGHAWAAGDQDAAARASEVLRRDLRSAGTPRDKASLVTALGNAGIPGDLATILRLSHDGDATVRAAAALALRKIHEPEARAKLLDMLTDEEARVAQAALVALAEHRFGEEDLERLAELVLAGRTALALDGRLLRLIVAQGGQLQPTGNRPGPIENALRLLLGRVEAAVSASASGEHRLVSGMHRVMLTRGASEPPRAAIPATPPPPAPPPRDEPLEDPPTVARPSPVAATMMSPPAIARAGAYQIVRPGDTVEEVRARLAALGLDPDARMSIIPPPPARPGQPAPRQGTGTLAVSPGAMIRRSR